jgi:membrane protease YdiL (CAAX protease family)
MNIVDHLFILLLFVAQPVYGRLSYQRYVQKIEAGAAVDPVPLYVQTALVEWVALFALFVSWFLLDRPLVDLGFSKPGGAGFIAGCVIVLLVCAYLFFAWRKTATMTPDQRRKEIDSLGSLAHFLPLTDRHMRHFDALSITAGIVEEIVFRGFVIWYLAHVMPVWAAAIVSSVFFGLVHSYQGASGIFRTGLIGLAFALLYVFTGSIWLPIVGHILFDMLQGRIIRDVVRGMPPDDAAEPGSPASRASG